MQPVMDCLIEFLDYRDIIALISCHRNLRINVDEAMADVTLNFIFIETRSTIKMKPNVISGNHFWKPRDVKAITKFPQQFFLSES